ncbi:MAG: SDR family oxidoreductase [Jaaginema sp. PMC 1079.18]|nr:SDR family oxidoreductase [Jaaginema sp. PMC 1080.18]MEC4853707.1 SDR family oxidoreductase [Jaaginema sp. PMC 1079.18]MEC4866778.1 SDR family oxidoreductase [Jaaginema sp. PMC 1078.18]
MRIAIIGCGYVGQAVAKFWKDRPKIEVTATTTTPDKVANLNAIAKYVFILKGDDPEALRAVLEDQDAVVLSVAPKSAETYEQAYLHTAKTLTSVLPEFPNIKQLVYTGSYSVYGDYNGEWVDENTPVKPNNRKSEILAETEQALLSAANDNLKVCILRLGGIYGPNRELIKIYGRAAGQTRPGTGNEPSNWIHLDDIVGAIDFAIQQQLNGIYNLADDDRCTRAELTNKLFEKHNLPPITWDMSQPSQRSSQAKVSNQKIKDAGYQFKHPKLSF